MIGAIGFDVFARDGTQIPASIEADPAPLQIEAARRALDPLVRAAARPLAPPTGRYNCHGLVLASRRANIPPPGVDVDLDDVLRRDGYAPIPPGAAARTGDLVAYRLDGEIEHTGFVVRVELVGREPVITVWSAWGAIGEYEHPVRLCPYGGSPEYWRLR